MFIELADQLRCARPHADTWLVLAAERTVERDVVHGTLGCPVCRAEYPIRGGAVCFDVPPASLGDAGFGSPDVAIRAAALLGLSEPGGFVLLCGAWAEVARPLLSLVETQLVLLDPPPPVATGGGVSVLYAAPGAVPLAPASVRAAALDQAGVAAGASAGAVRALRPGGRLVAPAAVPVPHGVTELARDATHWVAERWAAPSAPVQLGVARRPR